MLTLAGSLLMGLAVVNAQVTQDTTRTPTRQGDPTMTNPPSQQSQGSQESSDLNKTRTPSSSQGTQGSPRTQQGSEQGNQDRTRLNSTDVPSSLRSTLQGYEYKGWESGNLYRSNTGDGYSLEIGTGNSRKTYHFDKNGKRIKDNNGQQRDY